MIVKTYCARMDHGGCGILAHVENGRILKVEGDPDSPLSKGAVCSNPPMSLRLARPPCELSLAVSTSRKRSELFRV